MHREPPSERSADDADEPRVNLSQRAFPLIELLERVKVEVPEKRACPMDDLLSVWANAEIDGEPVRHAQIIRDTPAELHMRSMIGGSSLPRAPCSI